MRSLIIIAILVSQIVFFTDSVHAQDYEHAFKLRVGPGLGFAYKRLTGFEKGFELAWEEHKSSHTISLLRVHQSPAFPTWSDKWFFIYGYGGHLSSYRHYTIYNPFRPFDKPREYNKSFLSPGIDGYIGLEHRFLKHPFTFSVDLYPRMEFFGPGYFRFNMVSGFGLAYVF